MNDSQKNRPTNVGSSDAPVNQTTEDDDIIILQEEVSLTEETDFDPQNMTSSGDDGQQEVIPLMDELAFDEQPDEDLGGIEDGDIITLCEDSGAQTREEVLKPAKEAALDSDEHLDIFDFDEDFPEPDSEREETSSVTDTINLSAKKEAASIPQEEVLPLTEGQDQDVILLDEDIHLNFDEEADEDVDAGTERAEPDTAENLFDLGLQPTLSYDDDDGFEDRDNPPEILPLDADDPLNHIDSTGASDAHIPEFLEFEEDLSEADDASPAPIAGKPRNPAGEGLLFDDENGDDVVNVEDLEADGDDSEINNLIHDFFEDEGAPVDSPDAPLQAPPDDSGSEIQLPDDFFEEDEFNFTFETKDISDRIDELAESPSDPPATVPVPVIPLADDSGKPQQSPEKEESLAISEAQLNAAVEQVIERKFSAQIETMIGQAIEKVVSQEIGKLKRLLLDKITDEDDA